MEITSEQLRNVLRHRFGYDRFRLHQEAIIRDVLSGRDVMAIMPTGGGKSICYQLPALVLDGITVVISPLIALMKDQVDALLSNGIAAAYINSTLSMEEQQDVRERLRKGAIRLLYLAPERLFANESSFMTFLKALPCCLFAIDEAHCISQWGHDFRKEYLQLAALKQHFPEIPVVALTASADRITQQDILEKLSLNRPSIYIASFNRPNISYYIEPKKQALLQIAAYLDQHPDDSGIIYALSRSSTETIASRLREMGYIAAHYHAGMPNAERQKVQEAFKKDEIKIITATIAFGMGIDKPNVRFVMHYDVPKNMEGYYQETGRAGRDGLNSNAILYYSAGDIMKLQQFVSVEGNAEQSAVLSRKLYQMKEFAEHQGCRRQYMLKYFGEDAPAYCGACDYCLSNLEEREATVEAQKMLSAVYRTGERFGMDYIIDFLRGSVSSRIHAPHKLIKTYGIGRDLSKESWQTIGRQLLQLGLLQQEPGKFPVLKLSHQSWEVLRGGRSVTIAVRKASGQKTETRTEQPEHDQELLQLLKAVRRELAEAEHVPAYIIIGDNTLQEMATYIPLSFEDLRRISGFGDYKVGKYGAAFLEELRSYAQRHGLKTRTHLRMPKKEKTATRLDRPAAGNSARLTLELFREGLSIAEISGRRALSVATIESHLTAFIANGEIRAEELVPAPRLERIVEVIRMIGDTRALKPIKDLLDESFTYGEIRIAAAYFEAQRQ